MTIEKQRHFWRSTRNFFSNENHLLVSIPPYIWNGFTSADDNLAVLQSVQIFLMIKEISRLDYDDQNFHTIGIKNNEVCNFMEEEGLEFQNYLKIYPNQ